MNDIDIGQLLDGVLKVGDQAGVFVERYLVIASIERIFVEVWAGN